MRILIALSFFLAIWTGCGKIVPCDSQIAVVPAPEQVEPRVGCFVLTASTPVYLLSDNKELTYASNVFIAAMESLFGRALKVSVAKEAMQGAALVCTNFSLGTMSLYGRQ